MKLKIFLTYIFIASQTLVFAQSNKSAKNATIAHITFGSGKACEISADICSMQSGEKNNANADISYFPKTQELVFTFSRKFKKRNKKKLLAYPNKDGSYYYHFTQNYELPDDILRSLQLDGKYYIAKGIYTVTVTKKQFVLHVKILKK